MSVDVLILLIIVIVFVIIFLIILIVVLPLIKNKSNQTTQITQPLIDKFTSIEANLNKFNNDANEKFVKMNTTIANLEKSTVAKCEKIDLGVNELNATFSNSQKRGIGGEFILEAILTQAFGENNSIVQFQPTNEDGTRPDALINFANYKIPIDSKFPLVHYQQIKAHTNTNIELLKKNFKKDLDNEAKKVKGYINVEKNNINFAIIFLPFDNMLIDMMEWYGYTFEQGIYFASPSTILPILSLINVFYKKDISIKQFDQHITLIHENFDALNKMYEQFDGIVGEYNKLGEKLKNFYRAHNTILQIYKKNPLYLGNEKKAIATEIKKKNSEIINEITEHNINTDFDENN